MGALGGEGDLGDEHRIHNAWGGGMRERGMRGILLPGEGVSRTGTASTTPVGGETRADGYGGVRRDEGGSERVYAVAMGAGCTH